MLTPLFSVGIFVTSVSPIVTFPLVGILNPTKVLSVVVFPQPDGPNIVKNSPSFISKFRLSIAT